MLSRINAILFLSGILFFTGCARHQVEIDDSFTILVDIGPFASVDEAAIAEHDIDWSGKDTVKMAACTESFAAKELQTFLLEMTRSARGTHFPIHALDDPIPEKSIVLANLENLKTNQKLGHLLEQYNLHEKLVCSESFAILPKDRRIFIVGYDRAGTLYGVYHFLESLGVRWYAPDKLGQIVPVSDRLIADKEIIQTPKFLTRGFWVWEDRGDTGFYLWMVRNKINFWTIAEPDAAFLKKLGVRLTVGGHKHFHYFLNPADEYPFNHPLFRGDENKTDDPYAASKDEFLGDVNRDGHLTYFEAHPEWYGLIDHVRQPFESEYGSANICTSNKHAVDELTRKMVDRLADGDWREANSVNFWPIDVGKWCECEHCVPLGEPTDRLIVLVDQVYKAIEKATLAGRINREIKVIFPIYQETLPPPTRPVPENFNYEKCIGTIFPIWRCYVHALDDTTCSEYNTRIWNDFLGWMEKEPRYYKGQFFIGEYFNVSRIKSLPVLYMDIMAHDIPLYYQFGVRHAHYMHVYTSLLGMKRINNYLFAKLLWDPDIDTELLLEQYYASIYGAAASEMAYLYDRMEYAMSSVKQWRHKDHLAERIFEDRSPLFFQKHLQLKESHPSDNDGVDLEESLVILQSCRNIIDSLLAKSLVPTVKLRLLEDRKNLRYAENTVQFYYWFAQAIEHARANETNAARDKFEKSIPFARGLLHETDILQTASSHANSTDGLEATWVKKEYYEWGERLLEDFEQKMAE